MLKTEAPVKRLAYKKPTVEKCSKMTFPVELIESNGQRVVCRQCSSCHACR